MFCPFCSHRSTRVVNSRPAYDTIMRRRECLSCKQRFTTQESIDTLKLNGKLLPPPDDIESALEAYWRDCGA